MHRLLPLALALVLALAACGPAKALLTDVFYDEAALDPSLVRADLAYIDDGDDKHRLDWFAPAPDSAGASGPTILFVHGGGWVEGDRAYTFGGEDLYGNVGRFFATQGVATAVTSYRMMPGATWREQVADVAAALAFVQRETARLGGDPDAVVLMGHSAGAQLAAHVAYDTEAREQAGAARVCGMVSVSGAGMDLTDAATWETTGFDYYAERFSPEREPIDGPPAEPYPWQVEASPASDIDAGDPPTLLIYADGEAELFKLQVDAMARALRAAGVRHRAAIMPAINHEAGVFNLSRDDRVVGPETLAFLRGLDC
ncbi:alpha/beta hydrolase [Rubrivirga sp. IMCC43871]|uniref:alpha/beta hydrolase n=1 Tax=Rubrivirga sp. IMCC43871 TaxID=3391575 RepID=UPI00398FF35A